MTPKKAGGPAFPVNRTAAPSGSEYAKSVVVSDGLTIRDYFAAKAMQGMMTDVDAPNHIYIARHAYRMADAMLEVRDE